MSPHSQSQGGRSPGSPGGSDPSGPRRLTLDRHEIEELLGLAVRDRSRVGPTRKGRKSARVPMNGAIIAARVQHPGGGASYWEVSMIDLSDGGAGIIYPGFLHLGTQLVISLRTARGEEMQVSGKVIWCRLLRKQFHAVGVHWDKPIEARLFVDNAAWVESISFGDAGATRVTGRLLHLCANPVEHQLLKMQTSDSDLRVDLARDRGSLLDAIRTAPSDILVLDADSMGDAPAELMRAIRAEHHLGPVVIAAPLARVGLDELFIDDDVHHVCKPLTQDTLMAAIRTSLHQSSDPFRGTAPIYSTLDATPDKRRCIGEFLLACRAMTKSLPAMVANGDADKVAQVCRSLSDTGTGYGYPLLSETAAEILRSVESGGPLGELAPKIRGLVFLINRMQVAQAAA